MKKINVTSMLVASCLCLSACSAGNIEPSKTYADPYGQTDKETETTEQVNQQDDWQLDKLKYSSTEVSKMANAASKEATKQTGQETFFGNWIVKTDIKTSSVSAYGQKEIDKVLRKKITYSATMAKFNDNSCPNPKYTMTVFTEEAFMKDTRLSLKALGIKTKSAVIVDIFTSNNEYWSTSPAGHFIVKDKDTLILADQGQYFELVRAK